MVIPCPPSLQNSWNHEWINSIAFLLSISIYPDKLLCNFLNMFSIVLHFIERKFLYSVYDNFLLLFDDITHPCIVDCGMNKALHHCSSFVVFYVTFPSIWRHSTVLAKALLSEVAQSQIISISHEVLNFPPLHFFWKYMIRRYLWVYSWVWYHSPWLVR